jgi:hypothetical protein
MYCGKSIHGVERVDRDARHEACSPRSLATSSTKPPPSAAPREPARRQSAGRQRRPRREATAAVLRRESPFRDHSSVCRALGTGTQAAAARPTALPIPILQLSPAAHLYLSPDDTVSTTSASRSRAFGILFVERESVLDLGASSESRFKQMLRPPFRLARNGEGGGSLTAGHLQ